MAAKASVKKPKIQLESIIKVIPLICALFLPLYFGLGRVDVLDFNKQLFLIFFVCLGFLMWLLSSVVKGEFRWRPQVLSLLVLGFIISISVSTIASRWQWGSTWGWPLDTNASLITILCFFAFYLLIANSFEKSRGVFLLQVALIIGGVFVALIGILQLSGKFFFPWNFTKTTSFNTIGTVNSWVLFLGILSGPILAAIFSTKGLKKIFFLLFGIVIISGLIAANYWMAWVEVLAAMAVILVFGLWKIKEVGTQSLIIPIVLFSIALIFGVLKISVPTLVATPLEISPSQKATFDVAKQMLGTSTKDLILGWGPGTFQYGWSKFKSASLNQTFFWNIRFSKGASEILEMLGTTGVLATAFFILIILFVVYIGAKYLLRPGEEKNSPQWILFLGTFSGFVSLSIVKFLYPTNVSMAFLWWLFLGSMAVLTAKNQKILKLTADSKVGFLFSLVTIITFIGCILVFYLAATRYLSEVKYVQSLKIQDFAQAEENLRRALNLNPHQEIILRDLAQLYLAQGLQTIARTDLSDQDRAQQVNNLVASAVAAAKTAKEVNPENVVNWQVRAGIYREIIGLTSGLFEEAVECYEKALDLEPTNPFIWVSLAKTYLIQANLATGEEKEALLAQAENSIQRATSLKSDYAPAYYQMALIYEAQGKRQEAITTLEVLKQASAFLLGYDPMQDVGLAFQLGILYNRDEQYDKAQTEFERTISLNPSYSNARYFLGLIYDEKGQKQAAIEQFEEIEKLNPENEEVKKILANLREGKPALEDVTAAPETVPFEEIPEEQ
jgi:tetratricopeptide (TPR) repeat protein